MRGPRLLDALNRLGLAESGAIIESVDIYPTRAEICGLDSAPYLAGESFVPILCDVDRPGAPRSRASRHGRADEEPPR